MGISSLIRLATQREVLPVALKLALICVLMQLVNTPSIYVPFAAMCLVYSYFYWEIMLYSPIFLDLRFSIVSGFAG